VIRFSLACEAAHSFESWFRDGAAYDEQQERGLLTCPVCGTAGETNEICPHCKASEDWTEQIQAVCRGVIDNRVPAFFSLTVTGGLRFSPADAHDQLLLAAFNDHQRRAGRAGPEATTLTVNLLRAAEFTVTTQETPWRLTAESGHAFIDQMLEERLAAAVAQDPALTRTATAWLGLRRSQLAAGLLRLELDHCDILGLPGGR